MSSRVVKRTAAKAAAMTAASCFSSRASAVGSAQAAAAYRACHRPVTSAAFSTIRRLNPAIIVSARSARRWRGLSRAFCEPVGKRRSGGDATLAGLRISASQGRC
jgi:hypothetical protein